MQKTKWTKLAVLICLCLSLVGCAKKEEASYPKADMSDYATLTDHDPIFYEMSVKDIVEAMDRNQSFVVYFGFKDCPWCKEIVPILNDCAKTYGQWVGYVNTRKDSSWQSNNDIDDFDLLAERLGDYLGYDNDGNIHLYAPLVLFFKDGKVTLSHRGTVEGHNAKERAMTIEEADEVRDIYKQGFESMK